MKPNIVDGISRPPAAPFPKDQSDGLNLTSHPKTKAKEPKAVPDNKTKSESGNPTAVILITLIFMALLIGLAYFAYNKSR